MTINFFQGREHILPCPLSLPFLPVIGLSPHQCLEEGLIIVFNEFATMGELKNMRCNHMMKNQAVIKLMFMKKC